VPNKSALLTVYDFVCHALIVFINFETHSFNVLLSSFQNNNAACRVLYRAFLSLTYSIGLLFFSYEFSV